MMGYCLQVPRQQQQSQQRSQMAGPPPRMHKGGPTSGTRPPRKCSGISRQLTPPYHDATIHCMLTEMVGLEAPCLYRVLKVLQALSKSKALAKTAEQWQDSEAL